MLFQRVAQHQAVAAAAKAGKKSLPGGGGAAFAASPPSVATGPCGEAVAFNQRPRSAKAASGHAAKSLVRESRRVFSSLGGSVAALGSSGGGFGSAFEAAKNSVYSLLGLNSFPPYDGARERVVVLGTGWAALNFFRGLNPNKFEVIVISPRNYFTFTPLLPSVCAGTLTPLSCIEPVRAFSRDKNGKPVMTFYEAHATDIDFEGKRICEPFKLRFDRLVVAVGSESNTFNIPGVRENAFFLKEVEHAARIREKVMENFEKAALPTTPKTERERLLHFVVVGGGPTGVESAAEFADFVKEDMAKFFPELMPLVTVTLIEGGARLLGAMPEEIGVYTQQVLQRQLGVRLLLQHQVTSVTPTSLTCKQTGNPEAEPLVVSHGFVLWASGVGQTPLVQHAVEKRLRKAVEEESQREALLLPQPLRALPVTPHLKVIGADGVYAIGDCAQIVPPKIEAACDEILSMAGPSGVSVSWLRSQAARLRRVYPQLNPIKFDLSQEPDDSGTLTRDELRALLARIDSSFRSPVPTAQNARQAGMYLAEVFNKCDMHALEEKPSAATALRGEEGFSLPPAFCETWSGSLAYVGAHNAVAHLPKMLVKGGWLSLPLWKAVYLQMQLSWRMRLICVFDWLKTFLAGRDIGREHSFYK